MRLLAGLSMSDERKVPGSAKGNAQAGARRMSESRSSLRLNSGVYFRKKLCQIVSRVLFALHEGLHGTDRCSRAPFVPMPNVSKRSQ